MSVEGKHPTWFYRVIAASAVVAAVGIAAWGFSYARPDKRLQLHEQGSVFDPSTGDFCYLQESVQANAPEFIQCRNLIAGTWWTAPRRR